MGLTTVLRWTMGVVLASALGGCWVEEGELGPHCGDLDTALVEGVWRLEATGDRAGCQGAAVPDAEDVSLTSMALPVTQEGESVWLSHALAQAPSFQLDGDVLGRCVRLWTSEATPYGDVRYRFSGNAAGDHISGRFTATGPGTCRTEGTFTIRIR